MQSIPDEELARSAAQGDSTCFEEIIARHGRRVYRFCYRYAGNADDAEDWAQESLVRAYRNLQHYNAELPFIPWMMRVTANTCINMAKNRARHGGHLNLEEEDVAGYRSTEDGPLQLAINAEERRAVLEAIATLPPVMKAALTLRMTQEMPFQEIAQTLDIPLQTAATRVRRALEKVRGILAGNEALAQQMANLEECPNF